MSQVLRDALIVIRDLHSGDSDHDIMIADIAETALTRDADMPHFDHAELEVKCAAGSTHFIRGLTAIKALTEQYENDESELGTVYRTAKAFLQQGGVKNV